jgi:hypothetical protein
MTQSDSSSNQDYYCVHCATPCDSLYRQYETSVSNIKLTRCNLCLSNVDPYVEREWLLVILDCLLLRTEAYRHVLWHRLRSKRVWQSLLASSLLAAYLGYEEANRKSQDVVVNRQGDSSNLFWVLWLQSMLDMVVLWLGMALVVATRANQRNRNNATSPSTLMLLLFWALTLPSALNVVTILVLVWENSSTVKQLASVYVLLMQCLGVRVVMETSRGDKKSRRSMLVVALTTCSGLLARAVMRKTTTRLLQESLPCAGIEFLDWCVT